MSQWKFGEFEAEVDFTDADFLDRLDEAKEAMKEQEKLVPKTGKRGDIVRSQVQCFYKFFDILFGEGSGNLVFSGRHSIDLCIQAADSITEFEQKESSRFKNSYQKYMVQTHGNRAQKRNDNHNNGNYKNGNYGKKR